MTTFYSTKRKSDVTVPNSKVCGYRITNSWMNKGYSDGVRSGRDNGVVDQKLSRFATEEARENAGSNCAGNVNWINHRTGGAFTTPESSKNQFIVNRPAFIAGSTYVDRGASSIDGINRRNGMGNRNITRPAFQSSAIKPRMAIGFDRLQALSIADLSAAQRDAESKPKIMIRIPDITDTAWLNERSRMKAALLAAGLSEDQAELELAVNKPLGRDQRTVGKLTTSIADEKFLKVNDKLKEISQEITDGRGENRTQQANLAGQMARVLNTQQTVSRLTEAQLIGINQSLSRLRVPKNYRAVFPGHRVVAGNGQYFADNKGIIAMFLMSNIPVDNSPNQPIKSWHSGRNRYIPAALLQIYQMGADRFLDMENRTIDTVASLTAKGLVAPAAGQAGPIKSGQPGAPDFDLFA